MSTATEAQKNLLYRHRLAHELSELCPEYSGYSHLLFRAGVEKSEQSIPKQHSELYPHCPKCGSMRRSVTTSTRSRRSIASAKKKLRRKQRKAQEHGEQGSKEGDIIRNYIIAHCLTCHFVYSLPGSSVSNIRDYESRKRKYLSDLTYDPSIILEEMSSGGSASSSRAASPMPVSQQSHESQPQTNTSNKKRKKGKHPSSLQELLARNKVREMDKNSKSNTNSNSSSQPNTPSSGLGAFLSSYD
ncbi:hypothetical protein J056_001512 [Wallemia ichthyophaga EXF-994]|uniref:Uncharacterized protein n=2 Tax=Wallemia ichthyophaga TaxID=245174 RepID=A0A4T0ITJ1_WALIC|nr:uncharacterized protein J056_001512 [Wallemia ichthyophaga EXF-994]EOQ99680.1 hypothetical protein J056_001512 [Wallemia ichthyophaga EXF-994]TIB33316.1 hypothetical protein E3P86_03005 [Wallemia ichthyophaga]